MGLTYRAIGTEVLPRGYNESVSEHPVHYQATREPAGFDWRVVMPGFGALAIPVDSLVGGDRHGLSFLARLRSVRGLQLDRAPLIEARYLHSSTEQRLVLSPGFSPKTPLSLETGIGRVLSPKFEGKCLSCHGAPDASAVNEPGVHCETCHGPGREHLVAIGRGKPQQGILNPGRLGNEASIGVCARCHSGFTPVTDPLPDDLLISSQVTAIRNTECFIQSGAGFSCTGCHNPHQNAKANEAAYTQTCLGCHTPGGARHAALCPVNQKEGCIGCHMPVRKRGPFQMADHWIRVVSEQNSETRVPSEDLRSQVTPVRLFLRVIAVKDASAAEEIRRQLSGGASFFDLAVKYSSDPSASNGGYIGEVRVAEMEPALRNAAVQLRPGEVSAVVAQRERYLIVGRMPRDFRWKAGAIAEQASALRAAGKLNEASAKYLEALREYPNLLRAIILLGVTEGQLGKAQQAFGILTLAQRTYPEDPAAQYNLGIALEAMGRANEGIEAYRRAIALEPDLLPAYLNLGSALFASGQMDGAIEAYRNGINVNPLSAELYFNLAAVLTQQGKQDEAKRALGLASAINPEFVKRQSAGR